MAEPDTIRFDVIGIPATQSGIRAVATARGVRAISTGSSNLSSWRNLVADKAREHQQTHGTISTATKLVTVFRLPMPRSRQRTNQQWRWRDTTPDIDKLQRAVGDALTASALLADDKLIVEWHAFKIETVDWTGVTIQIHSDWQASEHLP